MRTISAKITGVAYKPLLCKHLKTFKLNQLDAAMSKAGSFLLETDRATFAVSWWVSAKRTRSYPYARVYDTLSFSGKKVTIIPVFKDEGGGDRDYLQWDTVSLMSLLGVYVIIAYYVNAEVNPRFPDKVTNQRFDYDYLKRKIEELTDYQSDALHWNMLQVDELAAITEKAKEAYAKISEKTGVKMHSVKGVDKRIAEIMKSQESFMSFSRKLAKTAQHSESKTRHEKENLAGGKGKITIKNYLGGEYYFTADELRIRGNTVFLIEGKNTAREKLPALEDIKDGLLKMVIFCNLKAVSFDGKRLTPKAVLKLTSTGGFDASELPESQKKILATLKAEAEENNFNLLVNNVALAVP